MKNVSDRYRESAQRIKELIKAYNFELIIYNEIKAFHKKNKKYLSVHACAAVKDARAELEEQERIHSLLAKEVQDNSHNTYDSW